MKSRLARVGVLSIAAMISIFVNGAIFSNHQASAAESDVDSALEEFRQLNPDAYGDLIIVDIKTECHRYSGDEAKNCVDLEIKKQTVETAKNETVDELVNGNKSCAIEGGLGWIFCPVINMMARAVEIGYDFASKSFLNIRSEDLFVKDGTSYKAWATFRDVANVMFLILILIIIMSQITSMGISNYGIKKTLPRVIMVAVLVNVSWYIAIIAVDISNIVGFQIQDLLSGLISTSESPVSNLGATISQLLAGAAGFTVAGLAASAALWFTAPTIGLALVGGVISIFTMIVILLARQAVVVILVVIAPIAIVLMALPNTEKYFSKWLKLFMAMLVTFPVCGLIMGGSNLAASVLSDAGGSGFASILYSLVSLLPMITTPMVIKKSLDGLGSIGGKLATFGAGMGSKAQGAIKNTATFDNLSHMGGAGWLKQKGYEREAKKQENAAWRKRGWAGARAGQFVKEANNKIAKGGTLSDREMSRLASSAGELDKMQREEEGGSVAAVEQYALASNKPFEAILKESMANGNKRMAGAAMTKMMSLSGGQAEKALYAVGDAEITGVVNKDMTDYLKETINNNDNNRKSVARSMPYALEWASGDGGNNMMQSLESYAKTGMKGMSAEDVARLRPDVQWAGMRNGGISRDKARDIVNNQSVNGGMDSDVLKGMQAFANGKLDFSNNQNQNLPIGGTQSSDGLANNQQSTPTPAENINPKPDNKKQIVDKSGNPMLPTSGNSSTQPRDSGFTPKTNQEMLTENETELKIIYSDSETYKDTVNQAIDKTNKQVVEQVQHRLDEQYKQDMANHKANRSSPQEVNKTVRRHREDVNKYRL